MPNTLFVTAGTGAGVKKRVRCGFTVTADRKPLDPVPKRTSLYEIPPGTAEVAIWAVPVPTSGYWQTLVTLTVASDGRMSLKGNSGGWASVTNFAGGSTPSTAVVVRVGSFANVTLDVLPLLKAPPKTRWTHRKVIKKGKTVWDPVEVQRDEQNRHKTVYGDGAWPPGDWTLKPLTGPHFRDPNAPLTGDTLDFDTGASLKVEAKSVVLSLADPDASPMLFAVVWPNVIAPKTDSGSTPVLLFIRQRCGQDAQDNPDSPGMFTGGKPGLYPPYPYNFDYIERCLFELLHYGKTTMTTPRPDFFMRPKGVPYQVAKAGADVVTIVPCNSVDKEFESLRKTEHTKEILEELRTFMFRDAGVADPPASVGNTAIACFSAGVFDLNKWLSDPANVRGGFLKDTVKAVYFLDPSPGAIGDCITAANNWANHGTDKKIRVYLRAENKSAHKALLGTTPPTPPYFENSADGNRTLAVIPLDTWKKTFKNVLNLDVTQLDQWDVHHFIAATMLTHALAQGDLK